MRCRYLVVVLLSVLSICFGAASTASEPTTRVVGGTIVPDERYPFMASIYLLYEFGDIEYQHICGGTFLNSRWILTAAHCVIDRESESIRGPSELAILPNTQELTVDRRLLVGVERIVVHPDYDTRTFAADIALIELSTSVNVTPIVLASADSAVPAADEVAIVTGWGRIFEHGKGTLFLRHLAEPIVPKAHCLALVYAEWGSELLPDSHICAGARPAGGEGACYGDSGGPLLVVRNNTYMQIGVVSHGAEGCARPLLPGEYTRVTSYVDWISATALNVQRLRVGPGFEDPTYPTDRTIQSEKLQPHNPERGVLARGETAVYEVTGGARVNLISRSGDADLLIVLGTRFNTSDIFCFANSSKPEDQCELPAIGTRMYALVYGYETSSYEIDVLESTVDEDHLTHPAQASVILSDPL